MSSLMASLPPLVLPPMCSPSSASSLALLFLLLFLPSQVGKLIMGGLRVSAGPQARAQAMARLGSSPQACLLRMLSL